MLSCQVFSVKRKAQHILLFLACLAFSSVMCGLPPQLALSDPVQQETGEAKDQDTKPADIVTRGKDESAISEDFVVARVKSVTSPQVNSALKQSTGIVSCSQIVELEILEGALKGRNVKAVNELTDNPSFNINVIPGKEVILSVVKEPGGRDEFNIADQHRAPVIYTLAALFLAAFLYFGGKSALKSLAGLLVAIALVALVLLPLSIKGFNPLLCSAVICFLSACATIFAVGGFSKKSAAALIGTIGGVIIAGLAAYLAIDSAPLTGLASEEAQILRANMQSAEPGFFSGLLAASMLIGALGVIMDVGISIASAVWELAETDRGLGVKELYAKGMNVGRDIMGSMTCTLVLAYAGSALPLLMLISNMPSLKLLNLDLVASELAAALTGSLGLVCTIPLTAYAASRLMTGGAGGGGGIASGGAGADIFAGFDQNAAAEHLPLQEIPGEKKDKSEKSQETDKSDKTTKNYVRSDVFSH